jgi:hypothetical protein
MSTLGAALEAFIREHEYCGELDTGLEGDLVWMTCTCGAGITKRTSSWTARALPKTG